MADEYKWEISGLKAGTNEITLDSKGGQADHLIIAVPLKGKVPPLSQIQKALGKDGAPPPPYVEPRASSLRPCLTAASRRPRLSS